MASIMLPVMFFLATLVAKTPYAFDPTITKPIHRLRLQSRSAGSHHVHSLSCLSWRFGVETNNIIGRKTIPTECEEYVGHYMLGKQYRKDSAVVTNEAFIYAKSLNLSTDGKYAWVFDVDETSLSNLPYYAEHGFGVEPFNVTLYSAWGARGQAPALPESLKLYKRLLSLGIKVVFLTGRTEEQRTVTQTNLKSVGYTTWEKLLLKASDFVRYRAVVYKSAQRKKLESEGYTIVGNIGDQWSDILGTNTGNRTFKLPNPMYYVS